MIVYHGSDREIALPDVAHSRKRVDFGPGFYVTPLWAQAVSWSERFKLQGGTAIVSRYELEEAALKTGRVLKFDAYNEEWLDFIVACRRGQRTEEYDLVMGGVANDKVFDTVELFFAGLIDKSAALGRLQFQQPNYQICLRTQTVIDQYLHFIGSDIV